MSAYEFSGPGDIDRSPDKDPYWTPGAGNRQVDSNALARDTETDIPEYGRANAQAGAGGVVGDDDLINHAYGES